MFPNPTAEPANAAIAPNLEPKPSLVFVCIIKILKVLLRIYEFYGETFGGFVKKRDDVIIYPYVDVTPRKASRPVLFEYEEICDCTLCFYDRGGTAQSGYPVIGKNAGSVGFGTESEKNIVSDFINSTTVPVCTG